tara:strand:- start:81 stop:497 length:417 start_codon:yes stop_codon:yes gene_type:complete
MNWDILSKTNNLDEEFIRDNRRYINWNFISQYQNLSEKLISDYHCRVNWNKISLYQKLSNNFIIKFNHKINFKKLFHNKKVDIQIYSYNFIYQNKPKLNKLFYFFISIKRIQQWWKKILYKPYGLMFFKMKENWYKKI